MIKKKLTSFLLAFVMVVSVSAFYGNDTLPKASANTDTGAEAVTGTAAVTGSALSIPFQTTTDGAAKVSISGTRFMVGGKELWFNGANTPWYKWNDFGSVDWQGKSAFDESWWDEHFEELHKNGINATRVWISCNGDVGMNISADGTFNGPNNMFWQDLDKLVKIAEKHQVYLMATVQSFDHYKDSNQNYKSWRKLIQSETNTDQYIDKFIIPLVKRYDSSDYFWSVDLCNEPDWIVENEECGKLSWNDLCRYYAKASAAIHKNSDVMVTVGLGMIKYNSDKSQKNVISDANLQAITNDKKSYVDFYSTHWYSWQQEYFGFPFDQSPEEFKLDGTKPCVIGECAAKTDKVDKVTLIKKYKSAYKNGWNGVFAWKTSGSDDGCGLLKDIISATNAMLDIAKNKIFPLTTTLQSLSGFDAELSYTSSSYTGVIKNPVVTVTDGTKTLVQGVDYSVKYSDNILPGTAKITITGIRDYFGTISKTFTIVLGVPKATVTAGIKRAKVHWKEVTGASGYEVVMAKSETGKYSLIKRTGSNTTSITKNELAAGSTYYFKVRTYIIKGSKKVFGSYSEVQYVTAR